MIPKENIPSEKFFLTELISFNFLQSPVFPVNVLRISQLVKDRFNTEFNEKNASNKSVVKQIYRNTKHFCFAV